MSVHTYDLPRRDFLIALGVTSPAIASAGTIEPSPPDTVEAVTPTSRRHPDVPVCLSPTEWAFICAIADTMIVADDLSASGTDLGIPVFIDRQLAGEFGSGARTYRSGPFFKGTTSQGYQLPLTPREYFALGVKAVNAHCVAKHKVEFDRLSPDGREAILAGLDSGQIALSDISGREFAAVLLAMVMEGFFSDPVHGGNRGAASWKMIGFPGLPAFYGNDMLDSRGRKYAPAPQSILDQS